MVRAKARESENLSYAKNPAAGTILAAPAGGQAEVEFDFYNDSPDVASFYLEVDGLGPDWASGAGTGFESYAAASGGGSLRLTLTPPLMAAVGEYDFAVRIMSSGLPVNDGTALILRVDAPAEQPVEAPAPIEAAEAISAPAPVEATPPEPEARPEPPKARAPRTRVTKLTPTTPIVDTPEPALVAPESPVEQAAEPPAPAPPVPEPVKYTPAPEPAIHFSPEPEPEPPAPVVQPQPKPKPAPEAPSFAPQPTPRPVQQATAAPQPTPRPSQPAAAPPPAPVPSRPAAPVNEEPVLVDYNPRSNAAGQADLEGDEDASIVEPFLLDPKDGALIPLRPGETMLLRFPFVNDAPRERTYILDEDRALEDGWLTLVQDQANLTRNGQGELSVRLTPPMHADPGDYPFTITVGPQGGQIVPRVLTLSVLATPAVQLTVKDKLVKGGAFNADVIFPIAVESAGNADTAFRISVKAPQSETADGAPIGAGDIYESGQWRYLFDKEMETLRSPMSGQAPRAVPIQLRARRKGIWWFGFKEQHQFRVAAVPVTEPKNGGKNNNSVDLTAVRSRILPFPLFCLIPIVLLIALFLSGGPTDLTVANAAYSNGNAYWIVNPLKSDNKQINISWTSKSAALLRFTGAPQGQESNQAISEVKVGSGSYTGTVPVSSDHRDVLYHYRVSRLLGGADQDILAHFIYTRSSTPLGVTDGTTHRPLPGSNISIAVPQHGFARLDIKNLATQESRLDWWLVKGLDANSANAFSYIKSSGSLEPGATEHFLIKRIPDSSNAGNDEQIVLVTTDANRPVLTVTLKATH